MLHVKLPPTYPAERQYICRVVLGDLLGLDYRLEVMERDDVAIVGPDGCALRLADVLFRTPGDRWLSPASLPNRPLERWVLPGTVCQPTLPVLYGRQYYEVDAAHISLGLDIFGSIFFLLTRYEEAVNPAAPLLCLQEQFYDRPLADEYVEVLWRALQTLWPKLERRPRESRVLLSHDVAQANAALEGDYVGVVAATAGDLVRRGSPVLAVRRLAGSVRAWRGDPEADVCNTFDRIIDAAERYDIRAAFYFSTDASVASYRIDHPWIRGVLRRIARRGHELGLRAGPQVVRDFERWLALSDREGIAQAHWGGCQHDRRWVPSATWAAWAEAGLTYISALAMPDRPGFRAGTCHEYPVFDLRRRVPLRLRERPLIASATALLDHGWRAPEEVAGELRRLRERCRLVGGDFTLQWENHRLADRREWDLFLRFLSRV